jgi:hypothetical protein
MNGNESTDAVIVDSIAQLTQQLLSVDNGRVDTSKLDIDALNEEYYTFKCKTKELLKHLFTKLEDNALHEKEHEYMINKLQKGELIQPLRRHL